MNECTSEKGRRSSRTLDRRLLRRITILKCANSGVGFWIILAPRQELHGVDAPALWHLVGHPPQDTHLDKNYCTCVPWTVPFFLMRNQQLEKGRKTTQTCFNNNHHVQVHLSNMWVELESRYVQMISLDISTLSEPLRWAFTLIGGMPPCTMIQVLRLLRRPTHTHTKHNPHQNRTSKQPQRQDWHIGKRKESQVRRDTLTRQKSCTARLLISGKKTKGK